MSLEEQIKSDMNAALKAGEKEKLNTLRTTYSQIKDERIRLRKTLSDEEVLYVLLRGVKTRKDSIDLYRQGNRQDLVDKENAEINILQSYLPQQMSEAEVREKIKSIIQSSGAVDLKDIGKVMGQAMTQLKGKADGKLVQQIARSLLSS